MLSDPRARRTALAAVVALAACLRLWNYDFDVGHDYVPDAHDKIEQARLVAKGKLTPINWKQPYFLPYSGGALLAAVSLVAPIEQELAERVMVIYMIALSVAAVLLAYRTALVAFSNPAVALCSAAILAVVPINVVGSRYVKEDIPLFFWCQVCLLLLVALVKGGPSRHYLAAGLAIGLAIGTKLSGILLLPAFGAAHALRSRESRWRLRGLLSGWAVAGLLMVPAGFLLANPFVLGHFQEFVGGALFQASYSAGGHHDGTRFEPWPYLWTFYLRHALAPGLTLPLLAAALAGVVLAFRRHEGKRNPAGMLLAGWVVVYYLAFESSATKPFPFFARYLHPMVPALAILAASALSAGQHALVTRYGPRRVIPIALVVALIAWPLAKSALITSAIADDTRQQATRFIDEHVPPGSQIALESIHYSPHPDPNRFLLTFDVDLAATGPRALHLLRVNYAILNSFKLDRFALPAGTDRADRARRGYQLLLADCRSIHELRPSLPLQTYGFHNPTITICAL